MQCGDIVIAVPSLDQLGFQLLHESRDRHVERDAGGLQGNAQVFFVKAQLEAKRIAPRAWPHCDG